jgi:surface polysaccharide O-acyltransferase-like enzyme
MNRKMSYDLLRVISIYMVISIHVVSGIPYSYQNFPDFITIALVSCINSISVPLFFMLSGALLLDVQQPLALADLFKKRIKRIFIPFVLWSYIYLVARSVTGKIHLNFYTILSIIREPAYYQFWFIYTILAIYLILPFIQKLVINLNKRLFEYALFLWFLFGLIVPMLGLINRNFILSKHFDLNFINGYLGYFILGYYLRKYPLKYKNLDMFVVSLFSILLALGATVIELNLKSEGEWIGVFMNSYLNPFTAITASGVFSIIQNYEEKLSNKVKIRNLLIKFSELSFGVFYVHMLILNLLNLIYLPKLPILILVFAKTSITFILSLVICELISRFGFLRYILLGLGEKK